MASSLRSQAAAAARAGVHATGARAAALQTQMYHHALATGFSRGYLVSAGILVLAVIIALAMIRVSRQDLSGAARPRSRPVTPPHQAGPEARAQAASCAHDLGADAPQGDDDRVQQTERGVRFRDRDRGQAGASAGAARAVQPATANSDITPPMRRHLTHFAARIAANSHKDGAAMSTESKEQPGSARPKRRKEGCEDAWT